MERDGDMKKKNYMHLVTTKDTIKKFETFYVYLFDGSVFEYKLNEYNIFRDEDWLEVTKKDNKVKEAYSMGSIMRVAFVSSDTTNPPVIAPRLKPVA